VLDLVVTRQARADIIRIIDYIADHDLAAAQRVFDQLRQKIERLTENPLIYRSGRIVGTREMVVAKNYLVVYSVTDTHIIVRRVLHGAQMWPPKSG